MPSLCYLKPNRFEQNEPRYHVCGWALVEERTHWLKTYKITWEGEKTKKVTFVPSLGYLMPNRV